MTAVYLFVLLSKPFLATETGSVIVLKRNFLKRLNRKQIMIRSCQMRSGHQSKTASSTFHRKFAMFTETLRAEVTCASKFYRVVGILCVAAIKKIQRCEYARNKKYHDITYALVYALTTCTRLQKCPIRWTAMHDEESPF